MANTPTTIASVASRLTDEEIEFCALALEHDRDTAGSAEPFKNEETRASAVLRDYVRMRKDYAQAIEIARHNYKELKRLLAEEENGEAK